MVGAMRSLFCLLTPLALVAVALQAQTAVPEAIRKESAEHKYARQKMEEAKALCASSQVQYTDLHSKVSAIQDANSEGDMRPQHKDNNPPDQTACKLLEEQSGIVNLLKQYNDVIYEGHKQWIVHEYRMIRLG